VQCTVDVDSTTTSILSVTVNQCNGSGAEGGATVTCRTGIINDVTPPTTDGNDGGTDEGGSRGAGPDEPGTPTGDRSVRPGIPGSPDGPGTPGTPGAPGERTTSQITQIPRGGADAGGGSTSRTNDGAPLIVSFTLLLIAGWSALQRRRNTASA
jgi:hypothetical protein